MPKESCRTCKLSGQDIPLEVILILSTGYIIFLENFVPCYKSLKKQVLFTLATGKKDNSIGGSLDLVLLTIALGSYLLEAIICMNTI